ncbi:2-isopropylmalate synthase [Amorphoplanes nipponensis]|uniref:2-isopropylmalate synthase n=1 Tax=Actinoplanes nipponensis TaxID=135950 RepID=A0A919MK53_9ACTN|nr:2-isopropylmalate synthase [Actinoplanes nipponensis]GIE47362.1 2-isopropylmalate synthase [Actinoplanes nipponensis]
MPNRQRPSPMATHRYQRFPALVNRRRRWPDAEHTAAPRWCSVDLRDGNQALIEPMSVDRKHALFRLAVELGFKEIEVGFPAASRVDHEFVRRLIEDDLVPEDVEISVLTPAREELIDTTLRSLGGARHATLHLYNATSPLFREVVFGTDRAGCRDLAVRATRHVVRRAQQLVPGTVLGFEYSPELVVDTEPDFAVEVCEAVMDVWQPGPDREIVLNLPATVERYGPHRYADLVEWFGDQLTRRRHVCLSLHPHNDRGTAVAAAELGVLAGADRVEGCLFGNGERTGNVDLVTLALNLFSQGVDPELDLSDIDAVRRTVEQCNQLPVPDRHPYAGDLVYTSFSGSHQDAIKKGFEALRARSGASGVPAARLPWRMPYLPIDPRDVGRSYEAVIRVNSQSGKGGVAYLMQTEHHLELPRRLQIEFSGVVQRHLDDSGGEVDGDRLWQVFTAEYLGGARPPLLDYALYGPDGASAQTVELTAELTLGGRRHRLAAAGEGPLDALARAFGEAGLSVTIRDHHEHPATVQGRAGVVAYVECAVSGTTLWGVGLGGDSAEAALRAAVSAVHRAAVGPLLRPAVAVAR